MRTFVSALIACALSVITASAQTIGGDRFRLNTGPCVVHSGTGAPATALGDVCDKYVRTDAPYLIYSKTGASTWAPMVNEPGSTGITVLGTVVTGTWNAATVTVPFGGTGVTSVSANRILYGNGTDPLQSSANLTFDGSTLLITGNVGHPSYTSQTSNWRIDAAGGADFRYLYTDEMHAKIFIADLEQALAGSQIITKSVAMLSQSFTVPAAGATATLFVRDLPSAENMPVFESGDQVVVRSFSRASGSLTIADAVGVVTSYANLIGPFQSWTFTRNSGGNAGTMSAGVVIQPDSLALDFGVSGNGYYEVNAIDGAYGVNSPYAQVVTWATSPVAANRTVRARLGKLTGITGVANEFGLLAGTYAATNGQYFRASNQSVELHGVNLSLWEGGTEVIRLDRTAPSFSLGNPRPTAYGTGTGIWMGNDAAVYKFRVGNPSGDRVAWDGTSITVVSAGLTIDSSGILLPTTSSIFDPTRAYKFQNASGDTGAFGLWGMWNNAGTHTEKMLIIDTINTHATQPRAYSRLRAGTSNHLATVEVSSDLTPAITLRVETGVNQLASVIVNTSGVSMAGPIVSLGSTDNRVNQTLRWVNTTNTPTGGSISATTGNGFMIWPTAGTTYDFSLVNRSNSAYVVSLFASQNYLNLHNSPNFVNSSPCSGACAGAAPLGFIAIRVDGVLYKIPVHALNP